MVDGLLRSYGKKDITNALTKEWDIFFRSRDKESLFIKRAIDNEIRIDEITIEYFDKCHLLDWNILFNEIKNKRENELN